MTHRANVFGKDRVSGKSILKRLFGHVATTILV